MTKGKVTIYGVGGCGINIAKRFAVASQPQVGVADISVCFADTSRSNITKDMSIDDCYILPDVDGSGKIRKENYESITQIIQQIPIQFEPGDLNIVVFSTAGGTGSVIGPLLMKELLSAGHTAIALAVGSFESFITANNTLNTIKSLDGIARTTGVPLVLSFENNGDNTRRDDVDNNAMVTVNLLCRLASREHLEMDTADVKNWLRYERHTDIPAQLSMLEIVTSTESAKELTAPISIASLVTNHSNIGSIGADYQCTGYFTDDTKPNGIDEVHYIVGIDDIKLLVSTVSEQLTKLTQKRAARAKTTALVSPGIADENGMVL